MLLETVVLIGFMAVFVVGMYLILSGRLYPRDWIDPMMIDLGIEAPVDERTQSREEEKSD